MTTLVVALLAGGGACLAMPSRAGQRRVRAPAAPTQGTGWMIRWRALLSALGGIGALLFVGGSAGMVLAAVVGAGSWLAIGRLEPPGVRREREQAARELPHLVRLLGAALAAGAAPDQALEAVIDAAPGVASAQLAGSAARLRLGADPGEVWSDLAASPSLGPLGRALERSHSSGAPVAVAVGRLADELARSARFDLESRARAVGVKAALPLGICLLPCFLLIGIVPLAVGLFTTLRW